MVVLDSLYVPNMLIASVICCRAIWMEAFNDHPVRILTRAPGPPGG